MTRTLGVRVIAASAANTHWHDDGNGSWGLGSMRCEGTNRTAAATTAETEFGAARSASHAATRHPACRYARHPSDFQPPTHPPHTCIIFWVMLTATPHGAQREDTRPLRGESGGGSEPTLISTCWPRSGRGALEASRSPGVARVPCARCPVG